MTNQLFPALLRYWRHRRGMPQLGLALEAGVSARHVSFLESGRAQPSETMVLRLLQVLNVPLRSQNEVLRAAGFEDHFPEPTLAVIAPEIDRALTQMMLQQEPFPLTVLAGDFSILRSNQAANAVFRAFASEASLLAEARDMFTLLFDSRLLRNAVVDWEAMACGMVCRLQRELLQRGGDERLAALLERVLRFPDIPGAWRRPNFSLPAQPTQTVRLRKDSLSVGFLVTVTTFSAPQQVTPGELRVESCFPLDDATRVTCQSLSAIESHALTCAAKSSSLQE